MIKIGDNTIKPTAKNAKGVKTANQVAPAKINNAGTISAAIKPKINILSAARSFRFCLSCRHFASISGSNV